METQHTCYTCSGIDQQREAATTRGALVSWQETGTGISESTVTAIHLQIDILGCNRYSTPVETSVYITTCFPFLFLFLSAVLVGFPWSFCCTRAFPSFYSLFKEGTWWTTDEQDDDWVPVMISSSWKHDTVVHWPFQNACIRKHFMDAVSELSGMRISLSTNGTFCSCVGVLIIMCFVSVSVVVYVLLSFDDCERVWHERHIYRLTRIESVNFVCHCCLSKLTPYVVQLWQKKLNIDQLVLTPTLLW
jgi:hypothetical protein